MFTSLILFSLTSSVFAALSQLQDHATSRSTSNGLVPTSYFSCPQGSLSTPDGSVCCNESCQSCGGYGCEKRPGGSSGCCAGVIRRVGKKCGSPPCNAVVKPVPVQCPINAISSKDGAVCCSQLCGFCGGFGCERRPGGENNCCESAIKDRGESCEYGLHPAGCVREAKCPIGSISNSDGSVCCPEGCGLCGNAGCASNPGGAANCCKKPIMQSGRTCDITGAPCARTSFDK